MLVLAFIKAVITANIGNILACPNHSTLEKFNCIRQTKTLRGSPHWDIFTRLTKNAVFIKQRMVVKPGSKLYLLMTPRAPLISISIQKIQTNYMLPCGAGVAVPGSLEKAGQQVVFTKAMTEVKHGRRSQAKIQVL